MGAFFWFVHWLVYGVSLHFAAGLATGSYLSRCCWSIGSGKLASRTRSKEAAKSGLSWHVLDQPSAFGVYLARHSVQCLCGRLSLRRMASRRRRLAQGCG